MTSFFNHVLIIERIPLQMNKFKLGELVMDVIKMIVCPKCRCALDEKLHCKICNTQYTRYYGVYDIVNAELSADQEILWTITDEELASEIKMAERQKLENDWTKDYFSHKNRETIIAEQKLEEETMKILNSLQGDICDLATGMGSMLQMLLESNNPNMQIVCTDISKRILAWTKKIKQTNDDQVSYIATDGRFMSIKDDSFDGITSMAAFGNIPESEKVAKELYRILKKNGRLIIQGTYIEKGSKSFAIAESFGVEKGLVEEYLIDELRNAGFKEIVSTIVDEAIWAENPYDRIPVAGDVQKFCIIQAKK